MTDSGPSGSRALSGATTNDQGAMILGTDHYGSDYVDLVGMPDQPRANVGWIVLDGLVEDYRHDLARLRPS